VIELGLRPPRPHVEDTVALEAFVENIGEAVAEGIDDVIFVDRQELARGAIEYLQPVGHDVITASWTATTRLGHGP